MDLRDNETPNQPVPAGYERLSELRDRLGDKELKRRLQLQKIVAFELNAESGEIDPLSTDEWLSKYADSMLASGRKYHYFVRERENDDPANPWMSFPLAPPGRLLLVKLALNETAGELEAVVEREVSKGKRGASKVPSVAKTLRDKWPSGPPSPDRAQMMKVVKERLGMMVSVSTLDRARKVAWPSS